MQEAKEQEDDDMRDDEDGACDPSQNHTSGGSVEWRCARVHVRQQQQR